MVVRKRRKKNKLRGQRTHGGGGTKNRRGAGCRGGVGKAGSHKHKFSKYYTEFGSKRKLKPKAREKAVNLAFISENLAKWVSLGKVKKAGDMLIVNGKALGFAKVLGMGSLKEKIKLENAVASKKAAEKIIAIGGQADERETEEPEEAASEGKEVEE